MNVEYVDNITYLILQFDSGISKITYGVQLTSEKNLIENEAC